MSAESRLNTLFGPLDAEVTANINIGDLEFKTKPPNPRNPGAILRYPYEALTDETDYLQIDIRKYDSVATLSRGLTSNGTSRRRFNQPGTEINDV